MKNLKHEALRLQQALIDAAELDVELDFVEIANEQGNEVTAVTLSFTKGELKPTILIDANGFIHAQGTWPGLDTRNLNVQDEAWRMEEFVKHVVTALPARFSLLERQRALLARRVLK